jgi:hypothetical protein
MKDFTMKTDKEKEKEKSILSERINKQEQEITAVLVKILL